MIMGVGMITGHVFIATSLDGFIAREDGDIGWLLARDAPGEDHGYARFIAGIDAIIMGRGSFETVRGITPWSYDRPVTVLSARLADRPVPRALAGAVRFSGATPQAVMAALAAEGERRVYVDGGRVIQSFLRLGLIADMVITRVPVLLGRGRPLFGPLEADLDLVHDETLSFPSGLTQSRYRLAP
jgi:dihydrofolate reductase